MEFVFALYIFLLYYSFQKRGSTILLFLVTIIPFCYAFISSAVADTGIYKASRSERPKFLFYLTIPHISPKVYAHFVKKYGENSKKPDRKTSCRAFFAKMGMDYSATITLILPPFASFLS